MDEKPLLLLLIYTRATCPVLSYDTFDYFQFIILNDDVRESSSGECMISTDYTRGVLLSQFLRRPLACRLGGALWWIHDARYSLLGIMSICLLKRTHAVFDWCEIWHCGSRANKDHVQAGRMRYRKQGESLSY